MFDVRTCNSLLWVWNKFISQSKILFHTHGKSSTGFTSRNVSIFLSENMLSYLIFPSLLYSTISFAARIPDLSPIDGSPDDIRSLSSDPQLPLNISTSPSNASTSQTNVVKVGCDARRFGKNPKVKSCRDLFGYLNPDNEQYSFSDRLSGIPVDIGLPLRTYSSKFALRRNPP